MNKIIIIVDGIEQEVENDFNFTSQAKPLKRTSLFKTEIYERMTDGELDIFDVAIEQADRRTRLMWRDCLEVQVDSPLFQVLNAQMVAAFGADRASAILSLDL